MSKPEPQPNARSIWRVETIVYVVFTVIGVAFLYVVGGIGISAIRNGGLIPPPAKLERYSCNGPSGEFSLLYLHGTNRVQIKSASGMLDGTVTQNQFDWDGFATDRNVLGFAPPAEIVFEDSKTLRISGVDLKSVECAKVPDAPNPQSTGKS